MREREVERERKKDRQKQKQRLTQRHQEISYRDSLRKIPLRREWKIILQNEIEN